MKRFFRINNNSILSGVCTGLSNYLNVDVEIVRLFFIIGTILSCCVVPLLYLILSLTTIKK